MEPDGPSPPAETRTDPRRALLRAQAWGRIETQLTAIAFKRIRGRSMDDAHDLAQGAIADAYQSVEAGGWDPEKGPLMSFLVARVIGAAANERRRKRNKCEVSLDEAYDEQEEEGDSSKYEKYLAADQPPVDEVLDRRRYVSLFNERLMAQIAGDTMAREVAERMKEGLTSPQDLARATGRAIEEVRGARRRLRYHADRITKELSATASSPRGSAEGAKEVLQ